MKYEICKYRREKSYMKSLLDEGLRLNYDGLIFLTSKISSLGEMPNNVNPKDYDIDIVFGASIFANKVGDLKQKINKVNRRANFLAVFGENTEINRVASCDDRVDVIMISSGKRNHSLDHTTAKKCRKNNIAIGFDSNVIFENEGYARAGWIKNYKKSRKVANKYGSDVILTSYAKGEYLLRGSKELKSLFKLLGFTESDFERSIKFLERSIIDNKKTNGENFIEPGIELINE